MTGDYGYRVTKLHWKKLLRQNSVAGNFDEFLGEKYFKGIQSSSAVKSIN